MKNLVTPLFLKFLLLSILNITVLNYTYVVLHPDYDHGLPTSVLSFILGCH